MKEGIELIQKIKNIFVESEGFFIKSSSQMNKKNKAWMPALLEFRTFSWYVHTNLRYGLQHKMCCAVLHRLVLLKLSCLSTI